MTITTKEFCNLVKQATTQVEAQVAVKALEETIRATGKPEPEVQRILESNLSSLTMIMAERDAFRFECLLNGDNVSILIAKQVAAAMNDAYKQVIKRIYTEYPNEDADKVESAIYEGMQIFDEEQDA